LHLKAIVSAYDPAAMEEAKEIFSDKIIYFSNSEECIKGSEIIVILTEWNEFRALDPILISNLMDGNTIVDLRNIFDPIAMRSAKIKYISIGRN